MTPADHANTVGWVATIRDALSLLLDVPDNSETHEAALNGSAALDALQTQAETAEQWQEKAHGWRLIAEDANGVLFVQRAEAAEAERDRLAAEVWEQISRTVDAQDKAAAAEARLEECQRSWALRLKHGNEAEAERDHARDALRQIRDRLRVTLHTPEGLQALDAIARAALGDTTAP